MELLAQVASVDSNHLKDIVILVVAAIGAGSGMASIITSLRTQKREVSFSSEFITGKECGQKHAEIERRVGNVETQLVQIRHEMKADRIALDASDECRASRIHSRFDAFAAEIEEKIHQLPAQIIALLNNTKVIK